MSREQIVSLTLTEYESSVLLGTLIEGLDHADDEARPVVLRGLVEGLNSQLPIEWRAGDHLTDAYEVSLCDQGFVVLATAKAPEREEGEVVAGVYSQRARADRVCRHLAAGWTPAEANSYEWPDGRMGAKRPL